MDWLNRLIVDFPLILATVIATAWVNNWFQNRNRIEAYRQMLYGKLPEEFDKLNGLLSDISWNLYDLLDNTNDTNKIKATEKISASVTNQLLNTLTYSDEKLGKTLYECHGLLGEITRKAKSQSLKEGDIVQLAKMRGKIIVQMRRQMGIKELLDQGDLNKILRKK